jgi:cysteine desulfurase
MRSGTENVPGYAALGCACEEIYEDFAEKIDRMYELKSRFIEGVTGIEGVTVNGRTGRDSAPHIISVTASGVRSEVLLHSLEERGVYVSAGSACSSNKPAPSRTLQGIGLKKDALESTIRVSLSALTTAEEIDYAVECMSEIIPFRRKFTRR